MKAPWIEKLTPVEAWLWVLGLIAAVTDQTRFLVVPRWEDV